MDKKEKLHSRQIIQLNRIRVKNGDLPGSGVEDHFDPGHCKSTASRIEARILKSYGALLLAEESKKKILGLRTSSIL